MCSDESGFCDVMCSDDSGFCDGLCSDGSGFYDVMCSDESVFCDVMCSDVSGFCDVMCSDGSVFPQRCLHLEGSNWLNRGGRCASDGLDFGVSWGNPGVPPGFPPIVDRRLMRASVPEKAILGSMEILGLLG